MAFIKIETGIILYGYFTCIYERLLFNQRPALVLVAIISRSFNHIRFTHSYIYEKYFCNVEEFS